MRWKTWACLSAGWTETLLKAASFENVEATMSPAEEDWSHCQKWQVERKRLQAAFLSWGERIAQPDAQHQELYNGCFLDAHLWWSLSAE